MTGKHAAYDTRVRESARKPSKFIVKQQFAALYIADGLFLLTLIAAYACVLRSREIPLHIDGGNTYKTPTRQIVSSEFF
jgi:hypothetical protein